MLTDELTLQHNLTKASVIMIDSDLYSSAQQALAFCAPVTQDEAILFFDDWTEAGWEQVVKGDRQAFQEFVQGHSEFEVTPLESYAPSTASFLLTRLPARRHLDKPERHSGSMVHSGSNRWSTASK